jgi:F420-non-reducing hydrogenase large subunit
MVMSNGKKEITIDPITRLEGHGKISIFLNDDGNVEDAYLQIPELRGFERFCIGRHAEEVARIVTRICGVCPVAHHTASTKTLDKAFNVEPPETAKKLRELIYSAYFLYDHTLHFYYLGGVDFLVSPKAPKEQRNIVGVINKVGLEVGKEVIKHRSYGQKIIEMFGGKATHPVYGLPGGVSKGCTEEDRQKIEEMAKSSVEFGKFTIDAFHKLVLDNKEYMDLILSDDYKINTYYMGLVNKNNQVAYYDGDIRVVDPNGKEFRKIKAEDYLDLVEETPLPWSYIKTVYLKDVGWKGFVDGIDSGVFRVAPLGRLNASDGMSTPIAQEEYEKMYETFGEKPVHYTLATHWARVIEIMNACERLLELSQDESITDKDIRAEPGEPGEGIGVVEAARGTLIHHYVLDEKGLVKDINLIVATVNNSASMNMSVKKAAQGVIKNGEVDDGLLNMVEMAFRAYDPCFACATHSLPGKTPLEVSVYDKDKNLVKRLKRG